MATLPITKGRTWVTGETVTAAKLNAFLGDATVSVTNYQVASGTFAASSGDFVFIGPGDTVTLPASPSDQDFVTIAQDTVGLPASNATVDGGANNIDDNGFTTIAVTYKLDVNFIGSLVFTWQNANSEWRIT